MGTVVSHCFISIHSGHSSSKDTVYTVLPTPEKWNQCSGGLQPNFFMCIVCREAYTSSMKKKTRATYKETFQRTGNERGLLPFTKLIKICSKVRLTFKIVEYLGRRQEAFCMLQAPRCLKLLLI